MQPPSKKAKVDKVDPIMIGVIYIRWLLWIDPSEPLYGCPYVGQAVRAAGNTAQEVATARWNEENGDATRKNKRIGLMHELKLHGTEAFDDQIVEWRRGPRSEVQKWADEREKALIAEHGGPLRDQSVRCKQALNLDNGGKFGMNFESMDALRTVAWLKFQDEIEEYVQINESALVPTDYVNPVSGYRLGRATTHVRHGVLWKGHIDEHSRVKWINSLKDWTWSARSSPHWKTAASERTKLLWANTENSKKTEIAQKISETMATSDFKAGLSVRAKAQWANVDEETRAMWVKNLSNARWTPEARNVQSIKSKKRFESIESRIEQSKRCKESWQNLDDATRIERIRKNTEVHSTPEARKAASEIAKARFEPQEARDKMSVIAKDRTQREILEGKKPLWERRREWALKQQALKMASLTSDMERKEYKLRIEKEARSSACKKRRLNALRQVPGWENAQQKDVPEARRAGVLPSLE